MSLDHYADYAEIKYEDLPLGLKKKVDEFIDKCIQYCKYSRLSLKGSQVKIYCNKSGADKEIVCSTCHKCLNLKPEGVLIDKRFNEFKNKLRALKKAESKILDDPNEFKNVWFRVFDKSTVRKLWE